MGRLLDSVTLGPSRRKRAMHRKLRALDRADAMSAKGWDLQPVHQGPRDWSSSRGTDVGRDRPPRLQSESHRRPLVIVLVLALIGAGFSWAYWGTHPAARRSATVPSLRDLQSAQTPTSPPAGVGAAAHPIGHPPVPPAGVGGFAFEHTQTASTVDPVAWDPCRPIHYVVSGTAPSGAGPFVSSAITEMSGATGLKFIYDGTTSERPSSSVRSSYQPTRYGQRWAPLLIAWTTPAQQADLAGGIIGLGGGQAWTAPDGRGVYVTGAVALDAPQIAQSLAHDGPAVAGVMRAVVLHELGHALGLAHVSDPTQVMYPEAQLKVTDLGAGDRRGLAALGSGHCEPQL